MQQMQRLDSLGVLAGGIAHDFNNLLVGIMGGAELLAQSALSDDARESLQAITDAGQRAATLTTQLLAYAGHRDLGQREPVALPALLLELRRLLGNGFSKKAELVLALDPDAIVLGNRATVLQVVMNLLTNASDALNGASGTISVSARRIARPPERFEHALGASVADNGAEWVLIEVRDTGVGMDEATRARIFEPFFSTKAKGHGLGLAACLGIVSSHGGAILVESAPGSGSTFSVLMPATDAPRDEPSVARSGDVARLQRVLVVDDEPLVRSQVRRMLQSNGYSVEEAANGTAALEALERQPPALMLLDVTMPGLDGTEVVREARLRGHAMPIVLCSGYADFPLEQRLEPHTYDGFLAKPFSLDALLGSIAKALYPSR
jgi:CheY-like chemotaxis protein